MSRRRSNVARLGPLDPVLVHYAVSDASASLVSYIVCINVRVPERYKVWSLNGHGVCKVHLTARVKLFDLFDEDTFRSTFYDSRRCGVPFIGCKALNGSVKFIRYLDVIADSTSDIISTRNIFVRSWGKYPTMILPTCSNYTCRAYVPIACQKGFNKRCERERLRLLFVERKRIAFERNLSMVRDQLSDDVAMNYTFPPVNDALVMSSSDNSSRSSFPNNIEFRDDWIFC